MHTFPIIAIACFAYALRKSETSLHSVMKYCQTKVKLSLPFIQNYEFFFIFVESNGASTQLVTNLFLLLKCFNYLKRRNGIEGPKSNAFILLPLNGLFFFI